MLAFFSICVTNFDTTQFQNTWPLPLIPPPTLVNMKS